MMAKKPEIRFRDSEEMLAADGEPRYFTGANDSNRSPGHFRETTMTPRDIFLRAIHRQPVPRPAVGSATSVVTVDLMDEHFVMLRKGKSN